MSPCTEIRVIFNNEIRSFCSKCLRCPTDNCEFYFTHFFCNFTQKLIINKDGKVSASVWLCKDCKFLAPNPVISICTKKDLTECDCSDSDILCSDSDVLSSDSDILCSKHNVNQISKLDCYCEFDAHPYKRFFSCKFCDETIPKILVDKFPFVCKKSNFYETPHDFFSSTDIIHRFDSPYV